MGYLVLERTFCKLTAEMKFLIIWREITRDLSELQYFFVENDQPPLVPHPHVNPLNPKIKI